MIQAFIFDLDGTLIDSHICHQKASTDIFKLYDVNYKELRKTLKDYNFHGMRVREFLKILKDASPVTEDIVPFEVFYKKRQEIFYSYMSEAKVLPGAAEALQQVTDAKKSLSLVTSGTRRLVEISQSMFFPSIRFDVIITSRDVTSGKPSPECFEKAYERLVHKNKTLKKHECLVIEDSEKGIHAAHHAGMKTLYVPYIQKGVSIQSDYQLDSLADFQANDFI